MYRLAVGGGARVEAGHVRESLICTQFSCEPKTALNDKACFFFFFLNAAASSHWGRGHFCVSCDGRAALMLGTGQWGLRLKL